MCFSSVHEHVRACDCACASYCPDHTKTLLLIRFPAVWTWRASQPFDSQECLVCNSTGKPQLPTHTYLNTHSQTHMHRIYWDILLLWADAGKGLTPKGRTVQIPQLIEKTLNSEGKVEELMSTFVTPSLHPPHFHHASIVVDEGGEGGCFDCCQRNQFSFHALASNCSESLFGSVDTKWLHSAAIPLSLTHVSRLLQVVSTSNSVFNQAKQTSSCREHHHMAEETGIYSRAQLNKMICAVLPPFYHKKKSGKRMR